MNSLKQLLGREKVDVKVRDLPRSVVTHDSIAALRFEDMVEESESFRSSTLEDPPTVVQAIAPEPVDPLTATPDEVTAYREAVQVYRAAERDAKPYTSYAELVADLYYSYYTLDEPEILDKVDPGVELHREVMRQVLSTEEHREAREITRGDDILSAYATMRFVEKLKSVLGDELEAHMRQAQELEDKRKELDDLEIEIDQILPPDHPQPAPEGEAAEQPQPGGGEGGVAEPGGEAGGAGGSPGGTPTGGTATAGSSGGGTTGEGPKITLTEKAKEELAELQSRHADALKAAEGLAEQKPMNSASVAGIDAAARAAEEAAREAENRPKFGGGLGAGEPTYTSPEQALALLKIWAEDPELREMCALMGRAVKEFRYKRGKRIEGGNDEIVDVQQGDDLRRTIPAELSLLSDSATEDDFLSRFVEKEVLEYKTVGEENAGRGPVVIVLDGSGSMSGERNVYSRAVAMTVLQNTRIEKRDFALIEFSGGGQVTEWVFKSNAPLEGERVLDMASHFFGGGTVPILGMQRAAALMREANAFRKADVVIVGDGDGGFGPEDEKLRDELKGMGVRFFGIGIGGSWDYIKSYCDFVVDVHDFQLSEPGEAVSQLAERMS